MEPHERSTASRGSEDEAPKMTSVAIIAAFHMTGAVYDSRNRWWLFRTPRHQADSTSSPAPGKRIRTS
jgi:hypothetical protein